MDFLSDKPIEIELEGELRESAAQTERLGRSLVQGGKVLAGP
ncbi:hypothetical protein [Aeromonas sp. 2HA2]|nr:hypothetical protein [Aeromonas sp. 2HA2]